MAVHARPHRRGPLLLLRALLVVAAIGLAYHYSLLTLFRSLTLDTPLAYLGLVPLVSLLLAAIAARRWRWEPDVHDRYVDYIVGLPLLLVALLVMVVAPVALSSFFWRWRLDLLSLPVFAAGAITVAFGLRTAVRLRAAIVFLFLAWPLPYTLLLNDWLESFTGATVAVLRHAVAVLPVARPADGGDGSLFFIPYGADGFVVSVGSACSGVNGSLGFLLVGGALTGVLRGAAWRKLHWLANGLILTGGLNVARIMAIFAAGHLWGPSFALQALHPVIGLVTFNIGVVIAVGLLPWFGLTLDAPPPLTHEPAGPATMSGRGPPWRPLPVRTASAALCLIVGASALAGTADAGLRQFGSVAGDLGQPRLGEWSPAIAGVGGWTVRLTQSFPWVEQYFGRGATWNRYAYLATTAPTGTTPAFVNVDVISTWDLGSFSTYGLEACYGFHNYRILGSGTADLGAGVVGHATAYYDPGARAGWTALYWEWPVQTGARERYERVILNLPTTGLRRAPIDSGQESLFADLQLALASILGGAPAGIADPQLLVDREFLVGFARELVAARADHTGIASGA